MKVELAKKVHERRKRYFDDLDFHLDFVKKRIREIFPDAKITYLDQSLKEKFIRIQISIWLL